MKKTLRAIFLLCATAIGSGMLSLPIVLAKIGVVPIVLIMILFCALSYFSALVRVELNLQSSKGKTLGEVALIFSGPKVAWIGSCALKLLLLSVMAAYLYALSSIIQSTFLEGVALEKVLVVVSFVFFLLLMFPMRFLLNLNGLTVAALLVMVAVIVAAIVPRCRWESITWWPSSMGDCGSLTVILPVVLTSFIFQVAIHSLTKICDNDIKLLKTSCLWGSIIPAVVYVSWACGALCIINSQLPGSLTALKAGEIKVDELINMLSMACNWGFAKSLLLAISAFAMLSSIFMVGLSLKDDFCPIFRKTFSGAVTDALACLCVIGVPCFAAIFVPNAFIHILSFAGLLSAIVAIFVPIFLLKNVRQSFKLNVLNSKFIISALLVSGIVISLCEIYNLLG